MVFGVRGLTIIFLTSPTVLFVRMVHTGVNIQVLELYNTIKEATKLANLQGHYLNKEGKIVDSMGHFMKAGCHFFEVLYIGKKVVSQRKAPPNFIDNSVEQFRQQEVDELPKEHVKEVQRHKRRGSGTSVESLPLDLDNQVKVTENQLLDQSRVTSMSSTESNLSSASSEDFSHSDLLSSSTENISSQAVSVSNDSLHKQCQSIHMQQDRTTPHYSTVPPGEHANGDMGKATGGHKTDLMRAVLLGQQGQRMSMSNIRIRTMLLQIALDEICLISPDKKSVMLHRKFRDISFCSQGIKEPEHFGFIARDSHYGNFLCYIFRCATESVVDEIMQSLKQSFRSAFQQNAKSHVVCELCPMHQLHKLCQEIDGLTASKANELIQKRLELLQDHEYLSIWNKYQTEDPHGYMEMNDVLMMLLRQMCEAKQKDHTHISDHNHTTQDRNEFNIMNSKANNKAQKSSKFDDLRSKAKRSLASSFDSIMRGGKKKAPDDVKVAVSRDRSWTSHSSNTYNHNISNNEITPALSPISQELRDEFPVKMPGRGRSSTIGAHPTDDQIRRVSELPRMPTRPSSPHLSDRLKSPRRSIFDSTVGPNLDTCSPTQSPSPTNTADTHNPLFTPERRKSSYRAAIFTRVVTPARKNSRKNSSRNSEPDISELDGLLHTHDTIAEARFNSKEDIRAMWKKAIGDTILLIRMEKENKALQDNQDAVEVKRMKLDYSEITPCLKEVTKVWEEMLKVPLRRQVTFDKGNILACTKKGVPQCRRGEIWTLLIEQHNLHNSSTEFATAPDDISYEDLLKQLTTHQHYILIDLGRTFPQHPYFSGPMGAGQLALFNILKAYSLLDQEVGYCQGLSFVAGILLMHMPEEEAFNTLKYLMYNFGLRRQYRPDMTTLQIQMYQLSRLLHDHHRELYEHLEVLEIHPTLYAAPWFLTLFSSQFPLGFVGRLFDLLFVFGMEVVFKVALVLLGNHKELILECDSFEAVVDFLKITLPDMSIIQMENIFNQVFQLDISKKLDAYEVEYHVLQEEILSPSEIASDYDAMEKLEQVNKNLKNQKMELLEQLQTARNSNHNSDVIIQQLQAENSQLKSHMKSLELERTALLNTVAQLRNLHIVTSDVLENGNMSVLNPEKMDDVSRSIIVDNGCHSEHSDSSGADDEVVTIKREPSRNHRT